MKCLAAMNSDETWLWHRILGHVSMSILAKVFKNDLVRGLPKIKFEKDGLDHTLLPKIKVDSMS